MDVFVYLFRQWVHQGDPVEKIPDDFVMAGRVSFLLDMYKCTCVCVYVCICLYSGWIKKIL
jgi:hypothetical protein